MKIRTLQTRYVTTAFLVVSTFTGEARNEWLSGRTENGSTVPISVEALKSPLPPREGFPASAPLAPRALAAPAAPVLFDVTMSISDDPTGDNNGNTQDPGSPEQNKWERIVQHFADGIFEMTEGAHKIRRVRIFRKGRNSKSADIVWTEKGHPHVPSGGGVGEPGGHVNMFKIFEAGGPGGADYDMLADEIGSGYTMAHEWGHYFYGVYDEYKKTTTQVAVAPSVMASQWNATGGNFDWLNFSIKFNGGGAFQNTKLTRQHEVHEASCWETLARDPSNDPNPGSLGKRIFYPELAGVAPTGTNKPQINLPSAAARSALDIIWADRLLFEIVIDNSGSMAGSPLENAKAAAKLLVDRAEVGESRIGVIKFSTTASVISPVTDIASDAVKTTIKNAIDQLTDEGSTAIGDAAVLGLSQVQAAAMPGDTKVVFLLSDGVSNTGSAPLAAIPAYQSAQVPMFTFAFGSGADTATLQAMATQTGGKFYVSPTSLSAITLAFQDAFSSANSDPVLTQGAFSAGPTKEKLSTFPVDTGLSTLSVNVVFPQGAATAALIAPDRTRFSPSSLSNTGAETLAHFSIPNPLPGTWAVAVQGIGGPVTGSFQIDGSAEGDAVGLSAYSLEGGDVAFPHPILLRAKVGGTRPVAGAVVTALATAPDGTTFPVKLTDDGKAPDDLPNDGTYSGYFYYTQTGLYEFVVKVDNSKKKARYTSTGEVASASVDGSELPTMPEIKIKEGFVRTTRFSVATSGGIFAANAKQLPKGTFAGLFGNPGAGHEHTGAILLTLGSGGSFSGKLFYAGGTFILRGKLNANGGFAMNILRPGNALLQLNLQVDALNGTGQLTGTLREGGFAVDLVADFVPYSKKQNPSILAGNFSALILPDPLADPALAPGGTGFATGSIAADGAVRFIGRLADGQIISGASALTGAGEIPFYAGLYGGIGSIYGRIVPSQELGVSDYEGTLNWFKPMIDGDPLYPGGFETGPSFVGSAYDKLASGQRVIGVVDQTDNVVLDLFGGDLANSLTAPLTLDAKNKLSMTGADPLAIKLAIKTTSGLLGGSFVSPATHTKTNLFGVVLPSQNLAGGFFLGSQFSDGFVLSRVGATGAAQTFSSTDVPVAIPDPGTSGPIEVSSSLAVAQAGVVADLKISLDISHSFRGDLRLVLRAPSGKTTRFKREVFDGRDNLVLTDLDIPGLLNETAAGTWNLLIEDEFAADTGTLNSWSLTITTK